MGRKFNSIVSTAWAGVPTQTIKFCSAHNAPLSQSSVENILICPCQLPVPQMWGQGSAQYAECQNSKYHSLMLMAGPETPVGNAQAVICFRRKDIVPVLALKKESEVFSTVKVTCCESLNKPVPIEMVQEWWLGPEVEQCSWRAGVCLECHGRTA